MSRVCREIGSRLNCDRPMVWWTAAIVSTTKCLLSSKIDDCFQRSGLRLAYCLVNQFANAVNCECRVKRVQVFRIQKMSLDITRNGQEGTYACVQ